MEQIKIGKLTVDLYFNVVAANRIAERCGGDIGKISEKMESMKQTEAIDFICDMLCDLANGAVVKHNAEITLGLATGEPKPEYTPDIFKAIVDPSALTSMVNVITVTINGGSEFVAPENVNLPEEDIDLMELEAEINKEKKS